MDVALRVGFWYGMVQFHDSHATSVVLSFFHSFSMPIPCAWQEFRMLSSHFSSIKGQSVSSLKQLMGN
jgi:hypothetical protein